ncbi:hypothetical protein [Streptomyces spectabilis]|uniref:hypothetical protein n=1 Tax=Streptomyces spectabilis TaxID=68270 RepID=UPI001864C742|nr:hypothetical protein [Streptomyces spectabilis]
MQRHVIAPARFFSQVSNEIIRHPRLGSDAVRLLTWQLSLPEGADEPLSATARSARVGRAGFNRAKRELKAEGYFHEWREQRERGRWPRRKRRPHGAAYRVTGIRSPDGRRAGRSATLQTRHPR